MCPPAFVQFRQNIVQKQDRLIAGACAYELDLCQLHRKHRGSLLTLGPERSHVDTIKFEQHIVTLRPTHCDAAKQLDSSNLGKTAPKGARDRMHIGRFKLNGRDIPHREIARCARYSAMRFAAQPIQLGYDLGSPRHDPGAHRG